MDNPTLEALKKHIKCRIENNEEIKSFHLSYFGGEPLLAFNKIVKPLTEYTSDLCKKYGVNLVVSFTTNGYLINKEIVDFLKDYEYSMQITLDGGREFHDKTRFSKGGIGSFDVILGNIVKIAQSGGRIILRINYTSENIDSAIDVINVLETMDRDILANIQVDMQRVWQDRDNVPVDEEEVSEKVSRIAASFDALGIQCATNGSRGRVGEGCYGDKHEYALINFNGDIFKCTARDFTENNRCGRLLEDGSIEWDVEIVKLRKAIKLSREECRKCRIAPICFGGCRQSALENKDKIGCIRSYTSEDIDRIVMDRFIAANHL